MNGQGWAEKSASLPAAEDPTDLTPPGRVPLAAARGWRRYLPARDLPTHVILLCLLALAWLFDEPIARAVDGWYNGKIPLNGEVHQAIISLAQYAQPIGYLTAGMLMLLFDARRRGRIFVLVMVLLVTGLGANGLKAVAGRERPVDSDCATVFHGPVRNLADTKTASFPSGHTATAFALSYLLASFYPRTRYLVWPLAWGVAANRILTVRHFPSDVVTGAWFGYFVAVWLLESVWIWRLAERSNEWAKKYRWQQITMRLPRYPARSLRTILASPYVLVAACLAMYWAGNGDYSLWDRDEPRFATASREMLTRGDWIVPTFNGELRPDKPIFIYWLQRFAYLVLGDGPFAARFWSGIGGTIACLATWRLASEMFSPRVGLVAGWILALSPMLVVESKLGTVDAVLLAFIMLSMDGLWRVARGSEGMAAPLQFWISLSLGVLTKGPVALAVPALTALGYTIARRDLRWLVGLRPLWGLPLFLTLVLPWGIAVQLATDGAFLSRSVGHHVVTRAMQPLENHAGFPGYYVLSLLALMAPWAFLLPWAIARHKNRWRSDARYLFLASWILLTLVLFEIVRTKLVHYFLPAYPALAIVLASALVGRFEGARLGIRALPRAWVGGAMIAMGGLFVVVTAAIAMIFLPQSVGVPLGVMAGFGGIGFALAGRMLVDGRYRLAFVTQAAVGTLTMVLIGATVLPRVHESQVIVEVAQRLKAWRQQDQTVALWHYRDPSLIYNVGEVLPIVDVLKSSPPFDEARALATSKGSFLCPLTEDDLTVLRADSALTVTVKETISRWDMKGLRPRVVHVVEIKPAAVSERRVDSVR